jgi:hydroxypyruvate reductase
VEHRVIATARTLADRAAEELATRGWRVRRLPDASGEVEALALRYAEIARTIAPGEVAVAVGEPTVRLPDGWGKGRGGRAQQLALAVAREIAGSDAGFCAVGSDGGDGPTDAAGAAVDGESWAAAAERGLDPERALAGCDAYPLLDRLGLLERTGPTGTNLLDLHLIGR